MRLITRKKQRRAKRIVRAARTHEPSQSARQRPAPPLREMPACLKNRKKGDPLLTNSQQIEVLEWMANCIRDAGVAAGLHS